MAYDQIIRLIKAWRAQDARTVAAANLKAEVIRARGEAHGQARAEAVGEAVIGVAVDGKTIPIGQAKEADSALPIRAVGGIPSGEEVGTPTVISYPNFLLQASVVTLGDKTQEGRLIEGVSIAWFEIIKHLSTDPDFLFKIHWRKLEEIIAGAYERDGWPEVVLTSRSGDHGRDVIATKPGIGSIRIIDQVKAYKPGRPVTADEVRSVLGVMEADPNVSKGVITTSSIFAPGVYKHPGLRALMPYRLELKDGELLRQWLLSLLPPES